MPELRFVVKTGVAQFNAEDRKLIRSHVMKGKNLGRMRPLGSKFRRGSPIPAGLQLDSSGRGSPSSSSLPSESSSPSAGESSTASTPGPCGDQSPPTLIEAAVRVPSPRNFGSLTSTVAFADTVEPETIDVVLQFSSIAKQLLFPIETCILFQRRAENWLAPLAVDPASLHARIFTSLFYFDIVLPKRHPSHISPRTLHHGQQAVSLLRERISSQCIETKLDNNTISTALALAGHALWTGDAASAVNQIRGIHKMIYLRGGLHTFGDNKKLPMEILRCDLGLALYSGSRPVFFQDASCRSEPLLAYPPLALFLPERSTSIILPREIPPEGSLASTWTAMSDFCSVINLASVTEQRIPEEVFLNSMVAIMYPLLNLRSEVGEIETIRIGLVCLACSVFLPWGHVGVLYPHLASVVRRLFATLSPSSSSLSPQLVLWLLMTGGISVLDASDNDWLNPLLREAMSVCGVKCWNGARDLLSTFMWISLAHDKTGKRVFDSAFAKFTTKPAETICGAQPFICSHVRLT